MKIPRKITPDNIKDSIIQIVFTPGCPSELVIGRFENKLKDLFEFKAGSPSSKQTIRLPDGNELTIGQFQGNVVPGGFFVDHSDAVKVSVTPNTLVFNTLKNYPGWDKMFGIIKSTISKMLQEKIAESVQRVGVRYISQFDQISIFEKLKMSLTLEFANKNFSTTQFRSEFDDDGFKVILNLLNNYSRTENNINKTFSIVDIDVIKFLNSSRNIEEIEALVDKAHAKQKATFFSLLSNDFLKSLNPEY